MKLKRIKRTVFLQLADQLTDLGWRRYLIEVDEDPPYHCCTLQVDSEDGTVAFHSQVTNDFWYPDSAVAVWEIK